jgi:hypothetical protein
VAHAGRAELAKRALLPDSHPDKIFVQPPPQLETQWALSALDTPLMPSLVTRYAEDAKGLNRCPACVCVWDEESRSNALYVIDKAIANHKSIHVFHLEENRWQLFDTRGHAPMLEYGCTATAVRTRIVVFGGRPAVPVSTTLHRNSQHAGGWVHIFDTSTGIWTQQLVESAWTRKGHTASLASKQRIYIYGGDLALSQDMHDTSGRLEQDRGLDLVLLDAATMRISSPEMTGTSPPRRSYHSACLVPACEAGATAATAASLNSSDEAKSPDTGFLYIFGGKIGAVSVNDLMVLDVATYRWSYPVTTGRQPHARFGHSSALLSSGEAGGGGGHALGGGGALLIAGGQDHFGKVFADVWVLSLALGSWSCLPAVADGLQCMSVREILVPTSPKHTTTSALIIFGLVSLPDPASNPLSPRDGFLSLSDVNNSVSASTACFQSPPAPSAPRSLSLSLSLSLPCPGKQCLGMCTLERQVCEVASISARTASISARTPAVSQALVFAGEAGVGAGWAAETPDASLMVARPRAGIHL